MCAATTGAGSKVEHRPTDLVACSLVVQDKLADSIWELLVLPTALMPSGAVGFACGSRRTGCLDRVRRGTELVWASNPMWTVILP